MAEPDGPWTGQAFGPYDIHGLIGAGGMGEVYDAHDRVKGRNVALKLLPKHLATDPLFRKRFEREAHTAAKLQEPHIIPIHDFGEINGTLFIDMRKVDGHNLRELLAAGRMPPEQAVKILTQVGAALDAAHNDGLVHRDVKPENILVTKSGFVYLADFGIAVQEGDRGLTQTGAAIGSLAYMAPERFDGINNLPASDVYALGCVLYQMLSGSAPFGSGTASSMMKAHLTAAPRSLSAQIPSMPVAIDQVISQALAKKPEHRQGTASELARQAAHAIRDTDQYTSAPPSAWAAGLAEAETQQSAVSAAAASLAPVAVATTPPRKRPAWVIPLALLVAVAAVLGIGGGALAMRDGRSGNTAASGSPGSGGQSSITTLTSQATSSPASSSPSVASASSSPSVASASSSPSVTASSAAGGAFDPAQWTTYTAYHNPRFGFTINVPRAMTMGEVHEGGNGATFVSADSKTTLEASGGNNTTGQTPRSQLLMNESKVADSGGQITYKNLLSNGYVSSGYNGSGQIFYDRGFVYSNVLYELSWVYPAADKLNLNAAVAKSSNTFSPGPNKSS